MRILLSLPLWLLGFLLIVLVPLLSVGIQAAIRRRWPAIVEGEHNEVAGFLIAVVGVMYAVVLAFCVIVTWERFDEAQVNAESEASELRGVISAVPGLPAAVGTPLHDLAISYAHDVATVEWPKMNHGGHSEHAHELAGEMFSTLEKAQVASPTEQVFLAHTLDRLHGTNDYRIKRLAAAGEGIPKVLWTAIIIGGLLTIGFALLFGTTNERLHYLMIGAFTAVVTVQIFVILVMNYPYSGQFKVGPHAFETIEAMFK